MVGWIFVGKVTIGAPVVSPIIKNLATEEQQARNTSDNAFYMLQSGSEYDAFRVWTSVSPESICPNAAWISGHE